MNIAQHSRREHGIYVPRGSYSLTSIDPLWRLVMSALGFSHRDRMICNQLMSVEVGGEEYLFFFTHSGRIMELWTMGIELSSRSSEGELIQLIDGEDYRYALAI
jgi:hypothetical protein